MFALWLERETALSIPVDLEVRHVEALPGFGLPLAILSDRTVEVDLVVARTRHQAAAMDIAGIDDCCAGRNPTPSGSA